MSLHPNDRTWKQVNAEIEELIRLIDALWDLPFTCRKAASEEEIRRAEQELGRRFPRRYRLFLKCFGAVRGQQFEIFGLPNDRLRGDVVMMNQLVGESLPSHLLLFARDGDGSPYFFDLSTTSEDDECPVCMRVVNTDETVKVADDFLQYLRRVGSTTMDALLARSADVLIACAAREQAYRRGSCDLADVSRSDDIRRPRASTSISSGESPNGSSSVSITSRDSS